MENADDAKVVVSTVISYYNEDKSIRERIRTRVPISPHAHKVLNDFQKHLKTFAGIKEHASALGMESFDMRIFRIEASTNYAILTQSQWDVEMEPLLKSPSELNGKFLLNEN